ncbi:hypothetical protein M9979_08880 [Sphingomonas sp. RP10(2022)]|uniref:Uncharacterized protein n=1 Tax=Sphingomonas liriopis TaxID=2949094 RepID=A0A9X2KQW8_9SPHN|nr:hypothetical protein [Sphingomonas liriopis]MCP3734981.1 hypothetical protein [Sphingomonas liriopis]
MTGISVASAVGVSSSDAASAGIASVVTVIRGDCCASARVDDVARVARGVAPRVGDAFTDGSSATGVAGVAVVPGAVATGAVAIIVACVGGKDDPAVSAADTSSRPREGRAMRTGSAVAGTAGSTSLAAIATPGVAERGWASIAGCAGKVTANAAAEVPLRNSGDGALRVGSTGAAGTAARTEGMSSGGGTAMFTAGSHSSAGSIAVVSIDGSGVPGAASACRSGSASAGAGMSAGTMSLPAPMLSIDSANRSPPAGAAPLAVWPGVVGAMAAAALIMGANLVRTECPQTISKDRAVLP